jgi:hypothetical protein
MQGKISRIAVTFTVDTPVIALREGVWSASRYGDPTMILTADTAPELGELMRDD